MKVILEDVIEALVLMVFDGMVNGDDNKELIEEIEEGWMEDYIPLPDQYQINCEIT